MILQLTLDHVRQETRVAISNEWARRHSILKILAPWVTVTISGPLRRQGRTYNRMHHGWQQPYEPRRRQGHTDNRPEGVGDTSDATIHWMTTHLELTTHFIRQCHLSVDNTNENNLLWFMYTYSNILDMVSLLNGIHSTPFFG